jgi:MYXO-CTERM domain-containing protein
VSTNPPRRLPPHYATVRGSRNRKLVVLFPVIATLCVTAAPARAALPPVHVDVHPIDAAIPRERPLNTGEWTPGDPIYEQRLREAGSEEQLAVRESLLRVSPDELLDAVKTCLLAAAEAGLSGELQAEIADGQAANFHDALKGALKACVGELLPEDTPDEVNDALAQLLADQIAPNVQSSSGADQPINLAVNWPSLRDTTTTTPTDPAAIAEPHADKLPWGMIASVGALALIALVVGAAVRRRRP